MCTIVCFSISINQRIILGYMVEQQWFCYFTMCIFSKNVKEPFQEAIKSIRKGNLKTAVDGVLVDIYSNVRHRKNNQNKSGEHIQDDTDVEKGGATGGQSDIVSVQERERAKHVHVQFKKDGSAHDNNGKETDKHIEQVHTQDQDLKGMTVTVEDDKNGFKDDFEEGDDSLSDSGSTSGSGEDDSSQSTKKGHSPRDKDISV